MSPAEPTIIVPEAETITTASPAIDIPHNFVRRPYQWGPWEALMMDNKKRLICVNHRRSGKDKNAWNTTIEMALKRVGSYYYFLPTYSQARKIIWQGMDDTGFRFIDHIPSELLARRPLDDEMLIQLSNGSQIQLVGTDNIDRVVGTNPIGCVFSEYSLQNPRVWAYIEPILLANGGWAWFIFTPRGKNHAWKLYQAALASPETWYVEKLTVNDTVNEAGRRIITDAQIDRIRKEGREEAVIQQEYFVSFDAGMEGSYYNDLLDKCEREGRMNARYNPRLPVSSIWDLGISDATAVWFTQNERGVVRFVDYQEYSGMGMNQIIKEVTLKPYVYRNHYAPHDIKQRDYSFGQTRIETAERLGLRFSMVPNVPVQDGIDAARLMLMTCEFDATQCAQGLLALRDYRREKQDDKSFKSRPLHNWASNGADSFRYAALTIKPGAAEAPNFIKNEMGTFDVFKA